MAEEKDFFEEMGAETEESEEETPEIETAEAEPLEEEVESEQNDTDEEEEVLIPLKKSKKKTKKPVKKAKAKKKKTKKAISVDQEDGIHEEGTQEAALEEDEELEDNLGITEDNPEAMKEKLLETAKLESSNAPMPSGVPLEFLRDNEQENVFIGMKKSIYKKQGYTGALLVGRVGEQEHFNEKVHMDSLNPHVVFVCGARGSGKCLTGDTLITLGNGRQIPIKDLEKEQENVLALNHALKITETRRTEFFKRTVEKILKIKLRSGKEITLTHEHPLLTLEGWKPAEELSIGKRIATPRKLAFFGNKQMKDCDVKLLAYLIAEGHLGNQFVLFSNQDKKIVADFKQAVYSFDENLRVEEHSSQDCFRVAQKKKSIDISNIKRNAEGQFTKDSKVIPSRSSLMQWIESLKLYNTTSHTKFIPEQIFELPKEQIALFLNRLFSCDGSIHKLSRKGWEIDYCSVSENIARSVQSLLLKFGILSKIREKKTRWNGKTGKAFEVTIDGKNVITFIEEIKFYGKKIERQEQAFFEMHETKRNPNVDTIPKEIWDTFKPESWTAVGRAYGYKQPKSMRSSIAYAPSRDKLLKIAQIEENQGVQLLAESDIFWDEILGIEEINESTEVYDITVPGVHNFVANDIIVHNSYVMGVIAEELALKNPDVGMVVIDPIGVFWSMKYPNKEEKEVKALADWDLIPQGLDNLKVFIPDGMKDEIPDSTFDATFSIQPALLTGEDWSLTFGIERFSPSGLLLEKGLKKVELGYTTTDGRKIVAKKKRYGIDDIINCLETDADLNSREKGYKQDSVRALTSRFDAAKAWGIFDAKGTPLSSISKAGQLSIIDTSFLDDAVTALVIGILSRRILSARKLSTRREAAQRIDSEDLDELLESDIPPTWMFIDEAHTLIPSGNMSTPATKALVEYVKQGRRPGCSIVFATQQPSAIDSKVLSQLDIIMSHKLVFDDDIKSVFRRTPTIIPGKYKKSNFIKTLPVGVALTGDRAEETSRAFVLKVRPRMSQHEGRDAETNQGSMQVPKEKAEQLMIELLARKIEKDEYIDREEIEELIAQLNNKYRADVSVEAIEEALEGKGLEVTDEGFQVQGYAVQVDDPLIEEDEEEDEEEEGDEPIDSHEEDAFPETAELMALPLRFTKEQVKESANKMRVKKLFGLMGEEELIESIELKYRPLYKIKYDDYVQKNEFLAKECFVDAVEGEFLQYNDGFVASKGLHRMQDVSENEMRVLRQLSLHPKSVESIASPIGMEKEKVRKYLDALKEKQFVAESMKNTGKVYTVQHGIDLPPTPRTELLASITKLPFVQLETIAKEKETYSKKQLMTLINLLWPEALIKKIDEVFWPVYHVSLNKNGTKRDMQIDGFNGQQL